MQEQSQSRIYGVADLERLPDDGLQYELVDGWLVSQPTPGDLHGLTVIRIGTLVSEHVRKRNLGAAYSNAGFVLSRTPDTVRAPDVAFVSRERFEEIGVVRGYFPGAPDLSIEVVSPGDRRGEIHGKIADYLEAGSRLVWVIDPERRTVAVHRTILSPKYLSEDDTLDGEDVVPGFSVGLPDLFEV